MPGAFGAGSLGGLLNAQVRVDEIEQVTECAKLVAMWAGHDVSSWPDVRAVAASIDLDALPVASYLRDMEKTKKAGVVYY